MVKTTDHIVVTLLLAAVLLATSCVNDDYDSEGTVDKDTIAVELSIQTHAATSTSVTYVEGSEWENYIGLVGGDYRMYFFTNDKDDATAATDSAKNTLITEFTPNDIYSTDSGAYTTYRASGAVDAAIADYSSFKLVMLANWGEEHYPTVTPGETTIDDICNAEAAIFDTFVDVSGTTPTATLPSESRRIPFYGVREYEYDEVPWKAGKRTTLNGAVSLLRAVARVEVVITNDAEDEVTFEDVSVINYNARGYCAPSGVYLKGDYDHDYTWDDDFTDGLHLVNGANDEVDAEPKTVTLCKTTNGDGQETWVGYIPEYANSGTDYSYISVEMEGDTYQIYFGNYSDGICTAYDNNGDQDDRFDIYRNYLYRFYVKFNQKLIVTVAKWDEKSGTFIVLPNGDGVGQMM